MSADLLFFPGIHQPGDARHFELACISINRLERRQKRVEGKILGDSGAFTKVTTFGGYPEPPEAYARKVHRLQASGVVDYVAVVAEDYMCESFVLAKTGLTVLDHQRLTIERYDALLVAFHDLYGGPPPFEIMPVLQGYTVADYLRHIEMYGDRLKPGMWVGVGSVCKRQGNVAIVEDLLTAIKEVRPDLRLHGFWREDHGIAEPARAAAALQRRQHGLERRRPESGASLHPRAAAGVRSKVQAVRRALAARGTRGRVAKSQRLARGEILRRADRAPAGRAGATAPIRVGGVA